MEQNSELRGRRLKTRKVEEQRTRKLGIRRRKCEEQVKQEEFAKTRTPKKEHD